MIIFESGSYVLSVERASNCYFVCTANDGARILEDSELELPRFETQQVFVELYFTRASQPFRER
jgi:hypothetical protein